MNSPLNSPSDPYLAPQAAEIDRRTPPASSPFAIISFLLAVLAGVVGCATVVAAGVAEMQTPGGLAPDSAMAIIVGLCVFGVMGTNVVGIGLAFVAFIRSEQRRWLAIAGLTFNLLMLMALVALMAIGIAIEAQAA